MISDQNELWLEPLCEGTDSDGKEFMECDVYYEPKEKTRHVVDYKVYADLKEKLRVSVEKFELIRDAPALGALDYRSEKRWRKGTMETIKHIATDALTKIKGAE